jgi:hypothetical protein|tara:strand:- start:3826 stop:4851 length:1026 start_codon:yes stop_codon:yes gene_type:complete
LTRSTAFFINGGAGRVLTSIPAFELYEKENPEDNFIIVCEGGTDFYKGHPTLHNRAYDHWHKGLFEEYIKDRNCVTPEPYRVWEYYNQKCSLAQAFDITINNNGLRKVNNPVLTLNKQEVVTGANIVDEVRQHTGKEKVIVVQPFGRTTEAIGDFIIDATSRSFQLNNIVEIINILKKEYGVIIMSEIPVPLEEKENTKYPVAQPQISDIRAWAGIIECADHFLGCDSLGQHIVKALGKSATIITGSTYPVNVSYIDDSKFDIIDVGYGKRVYAPIRLTMEEEQDRQNDEVMEMSAEHIKQVCDSVRKVLGTSKKKALDPAQAPKLQIGTSTIKSPFGERK